MVYFAGIKVMEVLEVVKVRSRREIRKHVLLSVAVLLAVMFVWFGRDIAAVQAENDARTLIVGFDASFPPYGYQEESGEYVGFDLDLAEEVCKRNGWKLVKQPIDWDSKDMELNSGSIDCIWNGFTMNGREEEYTWSVPYVDNSQVVIVKADSDIHKLSDMADKIVAVQADSSALAAFTGEDATDENKVLCESFRDLQQVGDYNNAFMNLESGMVDAICMDIGVAKYQIESRGDAFRMLDESVSSEQYGIGFKKGNDTLRDTVQNTLFAMSEDKTFETIAKEWGLTDCICLREYVPALLTEEDAAGDGDIEDEENSMYSYVEEGEEIIQGEKVEKDSENDTDGKSASKGDFFSIVKQLGKGMLATLSIFFFTLLFSLPLGLLLTFVRMSKYKVLQWIARIYISIMRGTPLMLQLLVVFFGPYYLFKMNLSYSYRFYAVIIGFSLNYAAYFAEIFRSGIEGVPYGQREAASVLGYSRTQTFTKIIFPQMVKRVMPPVTNEVITLVKDTSLAFALAYTEMFTLAKQIAAAQTSILPLFVAGLFYYIFNFVVAFVMEVVEKKLSYYR